MNRLGICISFFLLLGCWAHEAHAQTTHVLSGKVVDKLQRYLPGATVQVLETGQVTITNNSGEFRIPALASGSYSVRISYVGYTTDTVQVTVPMNDLQPGVFQLEVGALTYDEVVVSATRASDRTPIPHQEISEAELDKLNQGIDLPILLDQATSVVTTSDAGGGIGYTGIRIRGSDPTRINVTVNGIPLNDSESQGTFWVNMPDFASSLSSVQIQRGVGTSTNGASAFGATVNLNTFATHAQPYGGYSGAIGSFNTQKHTVEFGSGLINNKFSVDGRLSRITSDGFIDRASSDLQSYYLSAGYLEGKTHLRFITFGGAERTYQAWYGVPQSRIDDGERTFNPYDYPDQVDDYGQTHYQLHALHEVSDQVYITLAGHYTKGAGFFEEYKGDRYNLNTANSPQSLSDYGLPSVITGSDTITETNLIRRRWLDNDFYGGIFSVQYRKNKWNAVFGGGYHRYEGDHYGEVIWAEYASTGQLGHRYYEGVGTKTDYNTYLKVEYRLNSRIQFYGDLQYRHVDYETAGTDNDLRVYDISDQLNFVNPKVGVFIDLTESDKIYASYAVGNREPSRNDYIDRPLGGELPQPETLFDYELGYKRQSKRYALGINAYYMDYYNQLVLTGDVNDVGAAIRQNVTDSYRAGVELEFAWRPVSILEWRANATFSRNKIDRITESIYSWDSENYPEATEIEYTDTDISFSPNVIAGSTIELTLPGLFRKGKVTDRVQLALMTKYVGEQFLDNSQSDLRKLDDYMVNDIRFTYMLTGWRAKEIGLTLTVRNALDALYSSNGWVYRFRHPDQSWGPGTDASIYAERDTEINTGDPNDVHYFERSLFPQAGINFLLGLNVRF